MQPNYPYYDNNSLKDLNQSGQGQNKQGKKQITNIIKEDKIKII